MRFQKEFLANYDWVTINATVEANQPEEQIRYPHKEFEKLQQMQEQNIESRRRMSEFLRGGDRKYERSRTKTIRK
jgi:hypothetical protein